MARFLSLLILTLLAAPVLHAADVDVYTGEVSVASQGREERDRALPEALRNALSRYSGLDDFEEVQGFDEALQTASSMMVTFYYRGVERLIADGTTLQETRLIVQFDPTRVENLARTLGLPLWPPERNALEVWIVTDNGRERQVLPLEIAYLREMLHDAARLRGQPLIWPEPDEDGMYPVDMQLLWGGYTEDLAGASGVGVLILAARREGPEWNVRANLGFGGEHLAWRTRDVSIESAMQQSLQAAIDQVAAIRAIDASGLGEGRHRLTVEGVDGSDAYSECLSYLQNMVIVEDVAVVSARAGVVTFELGLTALPRYLDSAIRADGVLEGGERPDLYTYVGGR